MKTCPAELAYRGNIDIGPARICGCRAVTPAGFCLRHDPATKPARDARGRILARPKTVTVDIGRAFAEIDLRACARNYGEEQTRATWIALELAALKYANLIMEGK